MAKVQAKVTESRLSREKVADGALALADAEGLEALTIRRLAQELGVTPMALYWHFRNKEELLGGVTDRIWDQVDRTRDTTRPLLEQFRAVVGSLIEALRRHRAVVALLLAAHDGEPSTAFLETTETALQILAELGFDPSTAAQICQNGLRTATALVLGEPGAPGPGQPPQELAEAIRRKRLQLESLPQSRYPCIVRSAEPLTSCDDPDSHYAFGVDFFMAGVAALTPQQPRA